MVLLHQSVRTEMNILMAPPQQQLPPTTRSYRGSNGGGHIEAPMEGVIQRLQWRGSWRGSYRGSNGGGHIEAPMEGVMEGVI